MGGDFSKTVFDEELADYNRIGFSEQQLEVIRYAPHFPTPKLNFFPLE